MSLGIFEFSMYRVLKIASNGAGTEDPGNEIMRFETVTVLNVCRDRDLHSPCDSGDRGEHLVPRHRVVVVAEGRGDRGASSGERREASGFKHLGTAHVPRTGKNEWIIKRTIVMKGAKS